MSESPEGTLVLRAALWWMVAILSSFLLGFGAILAFCNSSVRIVDVGTVLNVGMALAAGAYVGWIRRCSSLWAFSLAGTVVTAIGCDLLSFTGRGVGASSVTTVPALLAETCAYLIVGLVGMSVLLATGAALGSFLRLGRRLCPRLRHDHRTTLLRA